MLSEKMVQLGKKRSVIREIFEYSKIRQEQIGKENVFDFSIGNPSIPTPSEISGAMIELIQNTDPVLLHGYTSAQGDREVRKAIAEDINDRFSDMVTENNIYMTCGAAASLTITLNAIVEQDDEIIVLAPFFPEYRVFVEKAGAKLIIVKCSEKDFQIDFNELEKRITEHTKAVIVNSPNNPTGVIFTEDTISNLSLLLKKKQKEYSKEIFIISDEPYRELTYDYDVPYIPRYYKNTIICYSFSKFFSLPGERIGYILVHPDCVKSEEIYEGVCGAGRALGFVCAPSLLQYTVGKCIKVKPNFEVYKRNRMILFDNLTKFGYNAVFPNGAFYLFVKSLEKDANRFCEKAKEYELLLVPSDDFGFEGYVRICYCVPTEQIERSLPAFKKLIEEY